tara:strand:- start:1559 stop:2107 length:549 start_codon:yes stop_codon:yes gene_type:complete
MKWITRLLTLGFIVTTLISCAEQHHFTDKENLNNILNNLTKGKFYTCNLKASYSKGNKNYPDGLINKKIPYKINKNINLIYTENNIGLIYKNDKWGYGNSIFNKKTEEVYVRGSSYEDKDYDNKNLEKGYNLSFNKNTLKINLFEKTINSEYSCQQLHEILTEAMKKQLLQNFLLQKNSDRM